LPIDYSRIFQFQNFKHSQRKILQSINKEGVPVGSRVTVYLGNVPEKIKGSLNFFILDFISKDQLFVVFSLLPYERKFSVLNFSIQRHAEYTDAVKSKDKVFVMCGFRKYIMQPVFSSFTKGGGNNVHKFDRFLQMGRISVGTVYAPIQFGPAPIFMFKYEDGGMNWTEGNSRIFMY
jgi:pre-rRNA-processing protein TSR1